MALIKFAVGYQDEEDAENIPRWHVYVTGHSLDSLCHHLIHGMWKEVKFKHLTRSKPKQDQMNLDGSFLAALPLDSVCLHNEEKSVRILTF